jgi:hypothetical protein
LLLDKYSVILLLQLLHCSLYCTVADGQPASLLFADAGCLLLLIIVLLLPLLSSVTVLLPTLPLLLLLLLLVDCCFSLIF